MSTIKVDTYLTRGGASEIAIDKLKGASSASSISIVGEGGSTTTNLQQGLCKAWANTSGGGTPAVDDSFNNASVTDNGAGDQTFAFTNNMANSGHSCNAMTIENAVIVIIQLLGQSSSSVQPKSHSTTASFDVTGKNYSVHGDLA